MFSHFSTLSKWVLMFDMLAGRLELFPMLMLFVPQIWKDFFTHYDNRVMEEDSEQNSYRHSLRDDV